MTIYGVVLAVPVRILHLSVRSDSLGWPVGMFALSRDCGGHMTEIDLSHLTTQFKDVAIAVADPGKAAEDLPKPEQDEYRDAQQSVVDARRKAENHSGLYQLS